MLDLMPLMAAEGIHGSLATVTPWSAHWRPQNDETAKKSPGRNPGPVLSLGAISASHARERELLAVLLFPLAHH